MSKIDKLKLIFKKITRKLGFFMTSDEKQQKKKFLKGMSTHSEEMQDKLEPIPCPMHEDYDDEEDYKQNQGKDDVV
jgi:ferredoxin-thioredoxin reductase catalytic subunit